MEVLSQANSAGQGDDGALVRDKVVLVVVGHRIFKLSRHRSGYQ